MTQIFRRKCAVQVLDQAFEDLRVSFNVLRTLRHVPSQAEITLYNVASDLRKQIVEAAARRTTPAGGLGPRGRVRVRLLAGYETTGVAQVYDGDLREVRIEQQGPDIAVRISAGDGLGSLSTRGAARTFAAGTPLLDILRRAVTDSGLDAGNALAQAESALRGRTVGDGGLATDGNAQRTIDAVVRAAGLEWSVQDGQVQVLAPDRALEGMGVLLSAERGNLIGTPTEDQRRQVKCTSLMDPNIAPGRLIQLRSRDLSGNYRVQTVRYVGDTHGQPWYCEVEGRRLR